MRRRGRSDDQQVFVFQLTLQARRGEAERRSLKMTKDESLEKMVFDFTDADLFGEEQAASWWESSDTVRWEQLQQFGKVFTTVYYKIKLIRSAGMSKAVFSLQRSVRFQRALLFAIINPQVTFLSLGT